jgi:hypothetical protein
MLMLIDDFSRGPYSVVLPSAGTRQSYQSTGNLNFPVRRVILQASEGGPKQKASLEIGKGHLMLGTGALLKHAMWILYGVDKQDRPNQWSHDLRKCKGIRFHFDFNTLRVGVTIQIGSDNGGSAQNSGFVDPQPSGPFTFDLLFARFIAQPGYIAPAMDTVNKIHFILQSAATNGGNDYVIRKLEVF